MIIDLPDPDNTKVAERQQLRIQSEIEKFDEDHYLADYFDESKMIQELLDYKPEFASPDYCLNYTENEIDCLKSLPKKTYLLDKEQKMYAFAGLVDILFAYCYNNRVNCGEKNVESGWNISKLSSTLSWFDVIHTFFIVNKFSKCDILIFFSLIKDFLIYSRCDNCFVSTISLLSLV